MRLKSAVRLAVSFLICLGVGVLESLVTSLNSDLVCLPYQTVLDASSRGIPDRLDGPLHLDGRQLLEALGDGAAVYSALKGDGLVPGTTCAQRGVVAGVLRLARDQNSACNNSCIADRYRRNEFSASRVDRIAAWLLAPYLAWVAYATTINAGVVALN